MKLRALTLTNVRRFAGQRLHLGGIGDGITVLSQPNEFGKSTVFDAVHALFFERYGSGKRDVKALQPHAGGAVAVSAEVETAEGLFEVSKQWLSRPMARVTALPTGRVVASDDEAEAWIAGIMGGAGTAGPAGLLWVRQGEAALENAGRTPAEKSDREADRATRRTLLGDVLGGEIEAITGGRRMESVRERAAAALDALATATMKPKAGGPWAMAVAEAAQLRAAAEELDAKVAALRHDLAARAAAVREMAQVQDPQAEAERRAAFATAEAALTEARGKAAQLREADQTLAMATLARQGALRDLSLAQEARRRRAAVETALSEAAAHAEAADAEARQRLIEADTVGAALKAADATARTARATLDAARQAEASRRAAGEVAALDARVKEAEDQRRAAEEAQARSAALPITEKDIAAAETAEEALRQQIAARGAGAVTLTFSYDGTARARTADGDIAGDLPLAITQRARIDLPGFGMLTVDPRDASGKDGAAAVGQAQQRLEAALARCGAADLAGARARLAARTRAQADLAQAQAVLKTLAPDGIAALREALSRATALAGSAPGAGMPEPDMSEADLAEALDRAETDLARVRGTNEARGTAAATARAAAAAAQATLVAARQAVEATPPTDDAALAALTEALETARRAHETAQHAHTALAATAPNLARAEATHERTRGVIEQAQKTVARLTQEIARLDGVIATLADLGVEERLADTQGRLATAEDRSERFATEAHALRRLCDALDAARSAARDRFFAPVLAELEPLLHLIHPDAHLVLDEASLLPAGLARDGTEEPLDILSGGTREQIAILARLAFARLYAKAGKSLPIILDDALVHSDDDRIVAMFDALTMVAKGQQIIVLTCRQRAFQGLAGEAAAVTITTV